ncbi:MAG: AsmA family protein [Rickettsiales bacterium]|nr:AsmA family protein [Rickettsiales bacterium]
MKKSAINLPSKKLLIGVGGALLVLYVVWYAVLTMVFSADDIRKKTLAALSQHLGAEVTATDHQQFSLMPTPRLTLNNVQIKNHAKARHPSMLTSGMVRVIPSLGSIFGDLVVSVTFFDPKIEFETFADKTHSWDLPEPEQESNQAIALLQQIHFVDSILHYSNLTDKRDITFDKLSASFDFSSAQDYVAQGYFKLARDMFKFSATISGTEREIRVNNSSSTYHLKGTLEEGTGFTGEQKLESTDLGHLLEVFLVSGKKAPETMAPEDAFPFNFSSALKLRGKRLTLSDVVLGGGAIEGTAQAIGLMGANPEMNAQIELKAFSIDKLLERGVLDEFIADSSQAENIDGYRIELPEDKASSLPSGVKMTISLKSEQAMFKGLDISNLQLAAKLDNSVIDVAQLSGKLPGNGQFILKGKVEGSYDGLAFKGAADVAGQEFAKTFQPLLKNETEAVIAFPESLKRFRGKANLFVNPEVMRLSEGLMRVEKMQWLGTLVRQRLKAAKSSLVATNSQPASALGYRYEGAFRFTNVDLDELRSAQVRGEENADVSDSEQVPEEFDRDKLFAWMQGMMKSAQNSWFNLKLNFVDAFLDGKKRETANLRLILNRQLFALEEIEMPYNGSFIKGLTHFTFPKKGKPKFSAHLQLDRFDSEEFFGEAFDKDALFWREGNGLWSRKEFNILGLGDMDVDLTFRVGAVKHAEYDLTDMSGKLLIDNSAVRLNDFTVGAWGGKLTGHGKMLIAKLPTISGNVSLNGFDFAKLHGVTDLFSNLYGNANLRGQFSTTGVNPHSAIQNMKGSLAFAGSGLKVIGFNLANMVRAANAVRTVKDIETLVKFANRGGETKINTVQGNMNIDGGYLRTPMMRIATPIGNGGVKGQINLMDWKVNVAISVFLTALQAQNPPDIRLVFVGPLNEVGRSLDTQSLESFIAKTAAERLLVNP